jgi:1,4-alpha-glucan branching enzyme
MLSFMGNEFAQFIEWRDYEPLEWKMLAYETHAGVHRFVKELNHLYLAEKALWDDDHTWVGFQWMDADNAQEGILSFLRRSRDGEMILCILNFRPESRENWCAGVPCAGEWKELLSSDEQRFGGSGKCNPRPLRTVKVPSQGQKYSLRVTVPPLGGTFIKYLGDGKKHRSRPKES